jgi:tryptophan-rich sensory protein
MVAVIAEALFMGRKGNSYMRSLRQPTWAMPVSLWALIALMYYAICFFVIFRLREYAPEARNTFVLVIAVMAANSFWNYLYFRLRKLQAVFQYSAGYAVLACVLLISLAITDKIAAIAFAIYVLYLPYALMLFYRTWQLNNE